MSYPVGWDLVNITGTYVGRNGVPCVGSVTLSSPQLVLRSGTIVPAADIVFDLVNGVFSGQIPATDDPNAQPSGWVYTVTENVPGGRQGYQIVAPHTSPGIDLSTVVPVTMPMPPTFGFPYITVSQLAAQSAPTGASLTGYLAPVTGSVGRTVQSRLTDYVSVMDVGAAFYPSTSTTAFQQAATNGGSYTAPDGKYAIGTVNAGANLSYWSFFNVTDNSGNPLSLPGTQELWYGGSKFFYQPQGTSNAANGVVRVERITSYTGGTVAFECPTQKINTSVGAGDANDETGLLVILDNYATGAMAENVAVHFQSNKRATSPTWCIANEANDLTASANPTTGLVGIEQAVAANGTDSSSNRVGLDIIASRPNSGGVYSGTQAQIGIGLRLTNQVADTGANNSFGTGILFKGYYDNFVMDVSSANVTGGVVLNMATAQRIRLSNSGSKDIAYDGTGMVYQTGLSTVIRLNDDGSILFGGTSPATRLMGTVSSGTAAPVLTANKPGTGTAITAWLSVLVNGTQLWIPAWSN